MTTVSAAEPPVRSALQACRQALRRIADYTLDPALDRRMLDLGERKEFLSPEEHAELMALVGFAQKRAAEKWEATLALQRLDAAYPDLADA
jgi:hypothetical protein